MVSDSIKSGLVMDRVGGQVGGRTGRRGALELLPGLLILAVLGLAACSNKPGGRWNDPYEAWQEGYHAGWKAAQERQQAQAPMGVPQPRMPMQQNNIYAPNPPQVPKDPYRFYGYDGGGTEMQERKFFYSSD